MISKKTDESNIAFLEEQAKEGNVPALIELGFLYSEASGSNAKQAEAYFEKAASLGSVNAMFILGDAAKMRATSSGSDEDFNAASYWFSKAIESGKSGSSDCDYEVLSKSAEKWLLDNDKTVQNVFIKSDRPT